MKGVLANIAFALGAASLALAIALTLFFAVAWALGSP